MSDASDRPFHASSGGPKRLIAALVALVAIGTVVSFGVGQYADFRAEAAAPAPAAVNGPAVPADPAQQAVRGRMRREFPPPPAGKYIFPVDAGSDCSLWLGSFGRVGSASASGRHEGTDIMGSAGRAVYAMANGVLTKRHTGVGTSGSGFGWTVIDSATDTTYRYFHMTTDAVGWNVGDRVTVGDVIGFVGDTGTIAGNHHLHLEVRPNNSPVDPLPLLDIPSQCRVF